MRSPDASSAYTLLNTAFHDAGLLLPMRIRHADGRPAIWIEGISPEAAEELALTVQAGLEARVIRG
ncbi:hypothetical protein AB0912_31525 [Streptomyces sp. NPDC007084]|uniref:hypothetical protein n=1 Tax=Streptomyces sp. NPDC007084 TaxID=3154313 RepID=UPI00345296CA